MAKILIVDDEVTFCKLAQSRLEASGYEVITAYDGIDGLDKAQNEKPDLILIDIMMPRMTGGDAVRALKNDSSTSNIPIIFLSAVLSSTEETKDKLDVKIEGTSYPAMAKPIELSVLLAKIEELLKK